MTTSHPRILFVLLFFLLTGCASTKMQAVSESEPPYLLSEGQTQIIFMRPSFFGGAIQSSVFDVDSESEKLVGIVSAGTKVRYTTEPGEHIFMVIGESADFMRAHLEANKTYYALVKPRMGIWGARFSLAPVRLSQLDGDEFRNWDASTNFVENTEQSYQWAADNQSSIQSKRYEYWQKWITKSPGRQAEVTLRRYDGVDTQAGASAPVAAVATASVSVATMATKAAPTAETEKQSDSQTQHQIALFPMSQTIPRSAIGTDDLLFRYVHEYVEKQNDIELVYSDYDPRFESGQVGSASDAWSGSFTRKSPNKAFVIGRARKVGANLALLVTHHKRTAGWYGEDFIVTVYALNVATDRIYRTQGDELSYERTIRSAIDRALLE